MNNRKPILMALYLRIAAFLVLMAGALFGSAGRWELPFAWAVIGIYAVFMLALLHRIDPGLLRERLSPGPGGKDRRFRALLLPFVLGQWVVAGLDAGRFHWSKPLPVSVQIAGLVVFAFSLGFTAWAMTINRFFSPIVRIQSERQHHLIIAGPYQYVRHPGYLGMMLGALGSTLALGSRWALLPIAGYVVLLIRRTVVEDRFLREELAGYADYAAKVRYRLAPGIW